VNEEVLEKILQKTMSEHKRVWRDNEIVELETWKEIWEEIDELVFQNIEKLRELVKKEKITAEDMESLFDNPLKELRNLLDKDILWLWGGINSRIDEILSRSDFKNLLLVGENIDSTDNTEKLVSQILRVVTTGKYTKLATVTSWLCVMNPRIFFPLNQNVLPKKLREAIGLTLTWGSLKSKYETQKSVEEYMMFLKVLSNINKRLGIKTMIETAFYLSRWEYDAIYLINENRSTMHRVSPDRTFVATFKPWTNLNSHLLLQGYLYPPHLVSQFYTALKTKGFVILSGLTGTGKTKIAQKLAELLDGSKNNLLFLPVRPDWRDSKALLGYYNPLTGEYHRTKLLNFILKAKRDYEINRKNAMPYFVILDEMNLAHVEYYFADFLSILESGRDDDGFTREPIPLHEVGKIEKEQEIPRELKLPPNLYIIGTVNMDETTYSFSPKVLDRAFVVEFHDVELEEYPPERINLSDEEVEKLRNAVLDDLRGENGKFIARSKEEANKAVRELKGTEYWRVLVELNKALEPYDMHFGYRVVDEIALFFQSAKESQDKGIVEFRDDDEIFDLALLMKVLPKFHGNRKKLEEPLKVILVECLRQENNSPVKFRVSFTERANTRTLELPTDIDKLNREAIIKMLTNWEKYENNFRFKHTARKVLRMLRQLYEIGFASFS